jgi:hypothetical protein
MSKHQFNYLLQKIEKEKYYLPRSNKICEESNYLPTVYVLQVNVILLTNFFEVTIKD